MKQMIISIVLWLSGFVALADDAFEPIPVKEPELRIELLRRVVTDQEARNAANKWMNDHRINGVVVTDILSKEKKDEWEKLIDRVIRVGEENMKWLKGVVEKHGWPTNTLAGKDGANAAWLLVQHADADPKFQRQCLDLMSKLPHFAREART